MAVGTIHTTQVVPLPGLAARTTNYAMQRFVRDQQPAHDVGYVTAATRFAVYLWNGTAGDVVLTSIAADAGAEGMSWDAAPPDVLDSGTSLRVIVTVGVDGPLEYTALLRFVSACLSIPELTITGTRAPQLSSDIGYLFFPHNWADGLDESLAWKTDVLIAHDRTEQRVQLRTFPRRSWDLRLLVAGAGRRRLERWISMRKGRYLFAPVWRDVVTAAAPVASGSSVVTLPTDYLDFAVGRWIALWDAWDRFELRVIDGVGENYVSVTAPFERDWPEGTMVAPCRYGVCLQQRTVNRFTEEVGEYQLTFEAVSESAMAEMDSPDLYRSLSVCPLVPTWAGPEEQYDNKWVRLDNDTGLIEYDVQSLEPVLSRDASFLVIGRPTIDLFLRWLFARAGRLAPFWLAGNDRAFELAVPAAADAEALVIANIDYEYSLSGCAARTHIELITTDGIVIRRMISAVETLPDGNEQLTLDAPLGTAVSAATLNRCAWLELVRLDSDEINLHWVTSECIEVTLPIVVLP